MTDPRYPIGKFSYSGPLNTEEKKQCLENIEQTPARLREAGYRTAFLGKFGIGAP